jgi:prepilin-type processing-associated H-X9-DG protein
MSSSEDVERSPFANDWDGVLNPNSRVRLLDITDGTSQILAVSERSCPHGQATWTGAVPWAAVFSIPPMPGEEAAANVSLAMSYVGAATKPREVGGAWASAYHTSSHGVGANFLFCDGHVTFLTSSIVFAMFKAMATRAGGEVIDADY